MEEKMPVKFRFHGSGSELFGIYFFNLILIIFTVGIYYPWARAKLLCYLYGQVEFKESRLQFHGTSNEMFLGFLKSISLMAILYAILLATQLTNLDWVRLFGVLFFLIAFVSIIPFAIHGALRYRLSRTSYRGIYFGYRGELKPLALIFIKGIFLSIITLGIYFSWFEVEYRKYTLSKIRLGSATLNYKGIGSELFKINFRGILFTILTLGIFLFWFLKERNHYYINKVEIIQNQQTHNLKTKITTSDIFATYAYTYATIFTLGLALPWAIIFSYRIYINNVSIDNDFNPNTLEQTEEEYNDATGDDLTDMLDIGMV